MLFIAVKASRFIEPRCCLVFPAGEQHHLIASGSPGMGKRVREDRLAVPLVSVAGVRHNVFDDAVWPTAAREVGDDCERATGNQRIPHPAPENRVPRLRHDLLPDSLCDCIIGEWVILPVKVRVEFEQGRKVARFKRSDLHSSHTWRMAANMREI